MKIENCRNEIEKADLALTEAFILRMNAAWKIADAKKEKGLPIEDPAQEKKVRERFSDRVPEAMRPYYDRWMETLIGLSKEYQKERNETSGSEKA